VLPDLHALIQDLHKAVKILNLSQTLAVRLLDQATLAIGHSEVKRRIRADKTLDLAMILISINQQLSTYTAPQTQANLRAALREYVPTVLRLVTKKRYDEKTKKFLIPTLRKILNDLPPQVPLNIYQETQTAVTQAFNSKPPSPGSVCFTAPKQDKMVHMTQTADNAGRLLSDALKTK